MSKILLDYAVNFTQVSGTATASLAFLHNMGVICAPSNVVPDAVAVVSIGSQTLPATIQLTGYMLEGSILEVTTTIDAGSPLPIPLTLSENLSASAAAAEWAALINLETDLQAKAVGDIVEILVLDPAIEVVLTLVSLNVTGEIPLTSEIIEVVDPAELALFCKSPEDIQGAFDGGLSKVFLIVAVDILDVPALILEKECEFYTIYGTKDFTFSDITTSLAGWLGVQGQTSNSQQSLRTYVANDKTCGFFEDTDVAPDTRAYFGIFSFASLLSANAWRNQQYIPINPENGNPVITLGQAESLFDDRISFYIQDAEQGTRLGFFVAGGQSITDPYIDQEIQVVIQSEMLNYLAATQPMNIETNRRQLEQIGNTILGQYTDRGLLDPSGVNLCTIRTSNEAFIVNGEITTTNSEALWRVRIDALEGVAV